MRNRHAERPGTTIRLTLNSTLRAPVDGAMVLREFDLLRRRVAEGLVGAQGIAIGYDRLEVDHDRLRQMRPQGLLNLSASVLATRSRAHEVQYVATVTEPGTTLPTQLVVARGWTQTPRDGGPVRE